MRVLLVEDDEMIGQSLHRALEVNGWSVDWVKDGLLAKIGQFFSSLLKKSDQACLFFFLLLLHESQDQIPAEGGFNFFFECGGDVFAGFFIVDKFVQQVFQVGPFVISMGHPKAELGCRTHHSQGLQ